MSNEVEFQVKIIKQGEKEKPVRIDPQGPGEYQLLDFDLVSREHPIIRVSVRLADEIAKSKVWSSLSVDDTAKAILNKALVYIEQLQPLTERSYSIQILSTEQNVIPTPDPASRNQAENIVLVCS